MGYRVKDEETGGARLALMIHPGSLLSRNPPQLNFTLTDISPPFAALLQQPPPRAPSSMKRRQASIRLSEMAKPFVSPSTRGDLDSWKHFEGYQCTRWWPPDPFQQPFFRSTNGVTLGRNPSWKKLIWNLGSSNFLTFFSIVFVYWILILELFQK